MTKTLLVSGLVGVDTFLASKAWLNQWAALFGAIIGLSLFFTALHERKPFKTLKAREEHGARRLRSEPISRE